MLNVDTVIDMLLVESKWEARHLLALAKTLKIKSEIVYNWLSRKKYPSQEEAKNIIFLDLFLHDPDFTVNEVKGHKDREAKEALITAFERNIENAV